MAKAVIFDMDGVVANTQKIHSKIEANLFFDVGITITPEEIDKEFAGCPDSEFFLKVLEKNKNDANPDELIKKKWEEMAQLHDDEIEAIPGVIKLIDWLFEKDIPIAIASSSRLVFITRVLEALNIADKFNTIVSTEEVEFGKPKPDIYELAAKKLEVDPKDCVAIEDGMAGMISARDAGMKVVGLVKKDDKRIHPTHMNINKFRELDFEELLRI